MSGFVTVGDMVGKMRHRIQIIALTKTTDSDYGGEETVSDSAHATVWAERMTKEIGSDETVSSGQLDQTVKVNWRIRHLSTVTPRMLVYYDSLYYDIVSVLHDNTNTYTVLESIQRGTAWDQTET